MRRPLRKLGFYLLTFFIILTVNFLIFRLMPGDPVNLMFTDPRVSKENIERVFREFGLDRPLHEQYLIYIWNVLNGNLGISFWKDEPVIDVILSRLPRTIILLSTGLSIATVLGIAIGVYAASRRGRLSDLLATSFAVVTYSLPSFWLGLLLILAFAHYIPIFPLGGFSSIGVSGEPLHIQVLDVMWHLALPTATLVLYYIGGYILITRNSMIDVLHEDFIRTAIAKGLSERRVIWGHAFRTAVLPVATVTAINIGWMVAGVIEVEIVFSYPGVGRLIYDAIIQRDYPLLQGVFMVIAVSVLLANLVIDLIYSYLDPRVRTGE